METIILYRGILRLYWENGKENGSYYYIEVYCGYTGRMEKKMETTILYRGSIAGRKG